MKVGAAELPQNPSHLQGHWADEFSPSALGQRLDVATHRSGHCRQGDPVKQLAKISARSLQNGWEDDGYICVCCLLISWVGLILCEKGNPVAFQSRFLCLMFSLYVQYYLQFLSGEIHNPLSIALSSLFLHRNHRLSQDRKAEKSYKIGI